MRHTLKYLTEWDPYLYILVQGETLIIGNVLLTERSWVRFFQGVPQQVRNTSAIAWTQWKATGLGLHKPPRCFWKSHPMYSIHAQPMHTHCTVTNVNYLKVSIVVIRMFGFPHLDCHSRFLHKLTGSQCHCSQHALAASMQHFLQDLRKYNTSCKVNLLSNQHLQSDLTRIDKKSCFRNTALRRGKTSHWQKVKEKLINEIANWPY